MEEILTKARQEATDLSETDINNILDTMEEKRNPYFENSTTTSVMYEIRDELLLTGIVEKEEYMKKLIEYRLIDEVSEIQRGRHIRWIELYKPKQILNGGGMVMNIKFMDNGVHILCNNGRCFKQIKFDNCILFQKMNQEEQLILMVNEHLQTEEATSNDETHELSS